MNRDSCWVMVMSYVQMIRKRGGQAAAQSMITRGQLQLLAASSSVCGLCTVRLKKKNCLAKKYSAAAGSQLAQLHIHSTARGVCANWRK